MAFFTGFYGLIIGFLLGGWFVAFAGTSIGDAQRDYLKCLDLQAPQQVCLERYLLPRKQTAEK